MPKVIFILVLLITILAVIKLKDKKQGDRSFKSEVVAVDTSLISHIVITPKGSSMPIDIINENNKWLMSIGSNKVQAEPGTIYELLNQMISLKPKRVASTSSEQWLKYEVTDTSATRITIKGGKKILADLLIGKFTFDQQTRQMTSYVRNYDEKEVYAIDGYLSMMFNREAESYRDNSVLLGEPENWNKLVFTYPADSSFSLVKQNNKWLVNGIMADSIKVDQYFSKIRMLTSDTFMDDMNTNELSQVIYSVRVEGDNFSPLTISCFEHASGMFISSSLNYGNVFAADRINEILFARRSDFE